MSMSISAFRTRAGVVVCALLLGGCVPVHPSAVDPGRQASVASDPAAMMRIGSVASANGDDATAVAFYRHAAELEPGDVAAQMGYARSLAAAGQQDEALAVLQRLYTKDPGDAQVGAVFGRLLVRAGQPRRALAVLQDSAGRHPDDVALSIALGVALDVSGQQQAAQTTYHRVLAVQPDSIPARANLGLSLALSGDYAHALPVLRALHTEIAGTGRDAQAASVDNILALVRGLMGDSDGAAAILRRTLPPAEAEEDLRFLRVLQVAGNGKSVAPTID